MLSGEVPPNFGEQDVAVYDIALAMARARGPIGKVEFDSAEKVLGKEKIAYVAHVVAGYIYISLMCNIADVPLPSAA